MTRSVLAALLRVRRHREKRALSVVAQHREQLTKRLAELRPIHARLAALRREERQLAERLSTGVAMGAFDATALADIDNRRALLLDLRLKLREELKRGRQNVRHARQTLTESIHQYLRAHAKKDAALVQRDRQRLAERRLSDRRDASASEDHLLSRYAATEQSL